MAYSFRHTSPELAGVLIKEKVRCGKPNCRCVRLKQPHRWYYYLYWRDYRNDAKLKKSYIPKGDVRKLRRKIRLAKEKDIKEKIDWGSLLTLFNKLIIQETRNSNKP